MKIEILKSYTFNDIVQYNSSLSFKDLTSILGYLRASNVIVDYKVVEYNQEEMSRKTNPEQMDKEIKEIRELVK